MKLLSYATYQLCEVMCEVKCVMCNGCLQSVVLRYGKFQSTAGVEDAARVPQGKLMKWAPRLMDFVVNLNR